MTRPMAGLALATILALTITLPPAARAQAPDGEPYDILFIAIDDLLYLIHHIVMTDSIRGAVNASSPEAVTNAEFTATLARVLKRPAILPVPRFALRAALGEMADPLLIASARLNPEKAVDHGFQFAYPRLEKALRHVLGRF